MYLSSPPTKPHNSACFSLPFEHSEETPPFAPPPWSESHTPPTGLFNFVSSHHQMICSHFFPTWCTAFGSLKVLSSTVEKTQIGFAEDMH